MKIIIIGATGTIGRAVVDLLAPDHDIVKVGFSGGEFKVDIASRDSIHKLYQDVGKFDALISAAGSAKFGSLESLEEEDYLLGLTNKLMGQVNLVRVGLNYISVNIQCREAHPSAWSTQVSKALYVLRRWRRSAVSE